MISVRDAIDEILSHVGPPSGERVPIPSALDRVLAEPIIAARTLPAADNSAMDGYAVRAACVQGASEESPVTLDVVGEVRAGHPATGSVPEGTAFGISTGAVLPSGSDCVIRVEDTDLDGESRTVRIRQAGAPGQNIRRAGEDVTQGECVLEPGQRIRPAELGMLASLNIPDVCVTRLPRVGIIATGDEVLSLGTGPAEPHELYDSNSYSVWGAIRQCGAIPIRLGIAKDTEEAIREKIRDAAALDVLVTTAGVSMGEHDHVRRALIAEGGVEHFWKVAMKPGKPLSFSTIGDQLHFGLPGNPVSAMVSFELFVRPTLMRMAGHRAIFRAPIPAAATREFRRLPHRQQFIRVRLRFEKDRVWSVSATGPQGSGILSSMVRANGLALIPAGDGTISAGDTVLVFPLEGSALLQEHSVV